MLEHFHNREQRIEVSGDQLFEATIRQSFRGTCHEPGEQGRNLHSAKRYSPLVVPLCMTTARFSERLEMDGEGVRGSTGERREQSGRSGRRTRW